MLYKKESIFMTTNGWVVGKEEKRIILLRLKQTGQVGRDGAARNLVNERAIITNRNLTRTLC